MSRVCRCLLALPVAASLACEYDLEVERGWEIDRPRVLGVRMEVIEPAPIWPERLEGDLDEIPIAEALPGDRVRLLPMAVDGEGRARPPEEVDVLWFQCGGWGCPYDAPPCDTLEWTTDLACELGRGPVEFEFPPLGPIGLEARSMGVTAVVAREPGADVERCRAGLIANTSELSPCTVVYASVMIGPRWVLLHEAEAAGFDVEIPLELIPWLALLQPANRTPTPGPPIWLDAETDTPLEGEPPRVRPGQLVRTRGPAWRPADRQVFATVDTLKDEEGVNYVFTGGAEGLGLRYLIAGPATLVDTTRDELELRIDELAPPGLVRVVMLIGDERKQQWDRHALDMQVVELEVVP